MTTWSGVRLAYASYKFQPFLRFYFGRMHTLWKLRRPHTFQPFLRFYKPS